MGWKLIDSRNGSVLWACVVVERFSIHRLRDCDPTDFNQQGTTILQRLDKGCRGIDWEIHHRERGCSSPSESNKSGPERTKPTPLASSNPWLIRQIWRQNSVQGFSASWQEAELILDIWLVSIQTRDVDLKPLLRARQRLPAWFMSSFFEDSCHRLRDSSIDLLYQVFYSGKSSIPSQWPHRLFGLRLFSTALNYLWGISGNGQAVERSGSSIKSRLLFTQEFARTLMRLWGL